MKTDKPRLWLKISPHILFVGLLVSILVPGKAETGSFIPFLIFIVIIETVLLLLRRSRAANGIVSIVYFVFLVWELYAVQFSSQKSFLFPPPENVFGVLIEDIGIIAQSIFSSLVLFLIAFAIAFVFGVTVGLLCGKFLRLQNALLPIARVLAPIPALIYAPYAVALLSDFQVAAVFVIASGLFWPILFNMVTAINSFDNSLLDSARALNVSSATMVMQIFFPYCVPYLFNTLSTQVSNAFLLLVGAEMLGMTSGVGWYVKYYSDFSNYTRVLAGFIVIGVLVSIINIGLEKARKRVLLWKT